MFGYGNVFAVHCSVFFEELKQVNTREMFKPNNFLDSVTHSSSLRLTMYYTFGEEKPFRQDK